MNDETNTYRTDRAGRDITRNSHVVSEKVDDPKSTRQPSSGKVVAKSSVRVAREASAPYPTLFGKSLSEIRATGQRTIYTPDVAPSLTPHFQVPHPEQAASPGRSLSMRPGVRLALKANGIAILPPPNGAPKKKRSPQDRLSAGQQTSSKATSSSNPQAIPAEGPRAVVDAVADAKMLSRIEPFEGNLTEWVMVVFHCQTLQSIRNRDGTIRQRQFYFDYEVEDDQADEALRQLHLLEGAFLGLLAMERERRGDEEMHAIVHGEYIDAWCPKHCIQFAARKLEEIKIAVARVEEVVKEQAQEAGRLLSQAVHDGWVADEDWVGPVETPSSNV